MFATLRGHHSCHCVWSTNLKLLSLLLDTTFSLSHSRSTCFYDWCSCQMQLHQYWILCCLGYATQFLLPARYVYCASKSVITAPRSSLAFPSTQLPYSPYSSRHTEPPLFLNLLKAKRNLLYTRNQFVPPSKHFLPRLMMYKAKVAVCSDTRTKHSTQSEHHVEFLNVKPCGT